MIEDGKVPAVAFFGKAPPNGSKAPEPMLQVARGWAPHRWQAGCGSAFVSEKACNVKTCNGTPWKINMEPENTPLEKENHLPNHNFQVLC